MASPSTAEVQAMIAAAVAEQEVKIGQILAGQVSALQAEGAFKLVVDEANKQFSGQGERINGMIDGFNAQFEQHKKVIEGIVADFQESTSGLSESVNSAASRRRPSMTSSPSCAENSTLSLTPAQRAL